MMIDTTGPGCFHIAEEGGLLEPLVDLGEPVTQGDTLARLWSTERTGAAPHAIAAKVSGILAARHFPGLIRLGDCLAVVAAIGQADSALTEDRQRGIPSLAVCRTAFCIYAAVRGTSNLRLTTANREAMIADGIMP